jgi:hypothetical protein
VDERVEAAAHPRLDTEVLPSGIVIEKYARAR